MQPDLSRGHTTGKSLCNLHICSRIPQKAKDERELTCIHSDSQAVLKTHKEQTMTARLILEPLRTLNDLRNHIDEHLIWVVGHSSIEDEKGDCLAKGWAVIGS